VGARRDRARYTYPMLEQQKQVPQLASAPQKLEQEETRLWRLAMLFVVFLATALAAVSWDRLQDLPYHLGLLPVAALCVAIFFAAFSYGRRKRAAELKELMHSLQDHVSAPTEAQLDQLSQVIARSRSSFKELIDSFDEVAFAASLDGTFRTVNRRMAEVLGVSYGDVIAHPFTDFISEPKLSDIKRGLPRFLERRRWSGIVAILVKTSSRRLHFDCVLNAIVNNDGEVVGVSVLARDITGQKEKETRFTDLFETLQEGVYFSTPEGRLLEANAALVTMLGYNNREELIALDASGLNLEANNGLILGRSLDDHGGERTREVALRRKDGSAGIFLDTSRAVRNEAGEIIRFQGTLVDVTERRSMEKALRRQEEFQRYLLECFPDLILVVDLEERYSFVSSRVRGQLGYKPEDLTGKRITDYPSQPAEFLTLYRDVVNGRKKFGSCEYAAPHRDGSSRTLRASASPLFDSENKVNGVIISARDITLEKKLENQLIQSERLAAMGQMIGGFAHELNNPLTSILGVAELLQDEHRSEAEQKQLTILQQQTRRAAEIVQNLMYFSRPPTPGKSQINLNELVQRTLHLHAYSLRKNNITVDFLPEPGLPSVSGDPHQIMQVFLNLVLNAEQAMREVRDRGTLRIRPGKTPSGVGVIFQDDGPGIQADVIENIFDPFYTTKRPGRGTGLGLSICKAILREHGGNVEASSTALGGAIFTVTLPVATEDAKAASG
jgi:PAS domain S-box-containing protein